MSALLIPAAWLLASILVARICSINHLGDD